MSTPLYLFIGFVALGLAFFFTACFLAARPASGTTEWINYKCAKKFTFCPTPKSLTKYDLIPISILTLIAVGLMLLSAAFPLQPDNLTPFTKFLEFPLLAVGNSHFYLSHLLWVIIIPLIYTFLKNLTGGFLIPISGIILLFLDSASLILSQNTGTTGATLFVLTAFYLLYRYTITPKKLYLLFIGIALGIGIAFSASASFGIVGIISIFVIKEITLYLASKDKKQTITRSVLFIASCIVLPILIYFAITMLCEYTSFSASFLNAYSIFTYQFTNFDLYSFSLLSVLSLMVFIGGIFALPCCIYQVVNTKSSASLFAIILFTIYILSLFVSGLTGLLPIFAIPVIICSFSALHNRKQKSWIFAYMFTAVLYIGFLITLTLV